MASSLAAVECKANAPLANGGRWAEAAVFEGAGLPLALRRFPVPSAPAGGMVCRVRLATICGSDLHTINGRRVEPCPSILGHEIVGEVLEMGQGLEVDARGRALEVGDRVTWSIGTHCGYCARCKRGLPQKCVSLRKYGHSALSAGEALSGGYAEVIVLRAGTTFLRLDDEMLDAEAAPANCAYATAMQAVEQSGLVKGESAWVQGAGLLGLAAVAICRSRGAREVWVSDPHEERLRLAPVWGATEVFTVPGGKEWAARRECLEAATAGEGVDVVIQACGCSEAAEQGLEVLALGGRLVLVGLVTSHCTVRVQGRALVQGCQTVSGIHNYRPEHLAQALDFIGANRDRVPFAGAVGRTFALREANEAMEAAATGNWLRVGIAPGAASGNRQS